MQNDVLPAQELKSREAKRNVLLQPPLPNIAESSLHLLVCTADWLYNRLGGFNRWLDLLSKWH